MHFQKIRLSIAFVVSLWIHSLLFLTLFLYRGNSGSTLNSKMAQNAAMQVEMEQNQDASSSNGESGNDKIAHKQDKKGQKSKSGNSSEFEKSFGVGKEWSELVKNLSETSNLRANYPQVFDDINYNSGVKDSYVYHTRHYEDLIVKEVFPTLHNVDKPFEQILKEASRNLDKYNERNEIIRKFRSWSKGDISENRPTAKILHGQNPNDQRPLNFPKEKREKYFDTTLREPKEVQLYNFISKYSSFDPNKGDLPIAVRELYYDNLQRLVYPFSTDPTYMNIDYFDENLNKEDFLKISLYQVSRLKNSKTQTELLFAIQDIYEIQQKAWKLFFDFENMYRNLNPEKKKRLRIETLKRIQDRYKPVLAQKNIHSYEDAIKLYSKKREEISKYIITHSPDHYRTQDALFEMGRIHWDMGVNLNLAD
ncbi:MAG: hypothetical protein OEV66_12500, partial [Spirochaetia bacterium]|nr:hypothetical protein [Spirochaetia bacterium]